MAGEWKLVALGEVGSVVTGRTPPGTLPEYFGNEIPFLTPSDMDGRRKVGETTRFLSALGINALQKLIVPRGVAVSCIGWQMGKAVLIDQRCATNQQINTLIPRSDCADDLFVYYAISAQRETIFRLGAGGSRTPILNKTGFERFQLLLPPLPEQKAIATILGALDHKTDLNRRTNATLEAIA
ncbi:restriction endonuclease subunit S, partial [Nostoc sp. NIES-2111]